MGNSQTSKVSNVISWHGTIYDCPLQMFLYQQYFCNIERRMRFGMDLAREYYFGR